MESSLNFNDPWDSEMTIGSGSEIAVARSEDIDDGLEDADFDTASASKFGSITSSIYRHAYENGRRYHKYRYGAYLIPNDETEQNRDDIKHVASLELTRGKYFFAPIGETPQKIIDLGTGTGSWAIEVADMFPSAQVVGCDLSPIQPFWVPSNVSFVVDDIEDEWVHGDDWDLVHIRQVFSAIRDPPGVCKQSFSHLKSGGWIEVQDFGGILKCDDDTLPTKSLLSEFYEMTSEALSKLGLRWSIANDMEEVLRDAGFINIQCKKFKCPIGVWPKAKRLRLIGLCLKLSFADLMDALAPKVFPTLSKSAEQMEEFLASAHDELQETNAHIYLDYFFWYAQKPLNY